ncbi:hypothetical protein ACVBEQ_26120 [Nakamurella sp. GG22]
MRTRAVLTLLVAGAIVGGCTSGPVATCADRTTEAGPTTSSPATRATSPRPTSTGGGSTSDPPPTAAASSGTSSAAPDFVERTVQLGAGVADEASGIAAGPGAFFLIGDETGTDTIVAVNGTGEVIADIVVDGMSADNAEALTAGACGSTPLPGPAADTCLYVGDIGDNAARRDSIAVYRLAEPALNPPPADPVPADAWEYRYPDGPQNAESMLVDLDGSVIVVTKPDQKGSLPHRMYTGAPGGGELAFVREFRPPAAERPSRTLFTGNVATDLASGPGRVLLLTYDEVQQYTAPDPSAPLTDFPEWPHHRLPSGALPQAEGITATDDGCGYAVASEAGPGGRNGSLTVVSCR